MAGSGCWLGDLTVGTVEAHQFVGNQTFWPDSLEIAGISPSLQSSLDQKYFSVGPPHTSAFADANFGGAVFDRQAYSGGVVLVNGTAVITVCSKQSTTAYNTTQAGLDAASKMAKRILCYVCLWMILGCPTRILYLLVKITLRRNLLRMLAN